MQDPAISLYVRPVSLMFGVVAAAVALAARRVLPVWFARLTEFVAVALVPGAIAVRASGFLVPTSGAGTITARSIAVWVPATSVLHWAGGSDRRGRANSAAVSIGPRR